AVAPAHLVGQHGEEHVLVGELLLAGEDETVGERREDERELEPAQDGDEFGADDLAHAAPPVGAGGTGRRAYWVGGRRKRAGGLAVEEGDVAERVGGLLGRKIAGVDRLAAGGLADVDLDELPAVIEADEGAIGPGRQRLPDVARGQRVERLGDLGEMVAGHARRGPERDVVELGGRGTQVRLLLGLEVLAGAALGAGVDVDTVVVAAPGGGVGAGGGEIAQDLAPEAVVAYARDAALDARLVTRMAHPGGIDVEASGLGVLAEGRDDP